jgi:hypothetical protein
MLRWVILTHDHPYLHWDFLLEADGVLRAWRLAAAPEPGRTISATAIPDHRLMYLDYEGPVSGDRGAVTRWDAGMYERLEFGADRIELTVTGKRIRGVICLAYIGGAEWRLDLRE